MVSCLMLLWVTTWPLVLTDPKCGPADTDDPDQTLQFHIPSSVRLYGAPGSDISVPVELTNYQDEELSMMFSFQEAFPVYNLNSFTTHVELVRSVEPVQVILATNDSSLVLVHLHISHYVPLLYRSKVTVIAKRIITNITQVMVRREVSFYFTVVGLDTTLANYDAVPPSCVPAKMCQLSEICPDRGEDTCHLYSWVTTFQLSDAGSGLDYPQPAWPRDAMVIKDWFVLGTTDSHTVEVMTSCCYAGVSLQVKDLAGNSMVCVVGEVVSTADKLGPGQEMVEMLILVIIVSHVSS